VQVAVKAAITLNAEPTVVAKVAEAVIIKHEGTPAETGKAVEEAMRELDLPEEEIWEAAAVAAVAAVEAEAVREVAKTPGKEPKPKPQKAVKEARKAAVEAGAPEPVAVQIAEEIVHPPPPEPLDVFFCSVEGCQEVCEGFLWAGDGTQLCTIHAEPEDPEPEEEFRIELIKCSNEGCEEYCEDLFAWGLKDVSTYQFLLQIQPSTVLFLTLTLNSIVILTRTHMLTLTLTLIGV